MDNHADQPKNNPLSREASIGLGDERRTQRHEAVLDTIVRKASSSFPQAFDNKAELEGLYRFIANEAFDDTDVLEGHIDSTVDRAEGAQQMLAIHDTSSIRYPLLDEDWLRENLGRPTTQTQGYELHLSLLTGDGDSNLPLGVIGAIPFARKADVEYSAEVRRWWEKRGGLYPNESQRWFDAVSRTGERLGENARRVVHVMDREADQFCLLHWLSFRTDRFVIRAKMLDRPVVREDTSSRGKKKPKTTLENVLQRAPFIATVSARIGFRSAFRNAKKQKAHPARKERRATLSVRAATVTISRGVNKDKGYSPLPKQQIPDTLELNAVELVELSPPRGQKPVRWILLTNEPISSTDGILAVVGIYYRRWLVEEYFRALKTGCALEKRQMDTAARLLKVLAIFIPVAWSLLLTRTLGEEGRDLPWHFLLSPLSFLVLSRAAPAHRLNDKSTAFDTINAVAALGGHLKSNGPPGWITIQRGLDTLATLTRGAWLAGGQAR